VNEIKTAFKKNQIENIYPAGSENHFWNLARNYTIKRWIKSEFDNLGVCFDVGCGKGYTISYLRKNGYEAYGSDIADYIPIDDAIKFAFPKTELSQIPHDITQKVDCILLLDVIEHLPQPDKLLLEITKIFPNASKLLITVPARQEIWSNFDEFNCHYLRYSHRDFVKLAKRLNFILLKSSYFFHILYLPIFITKLLRIKRSTNFPVPASKFSVYINLIISFYFIIEQYIIPKKVYGTSLIGVFSFNRELKK